MILVSCLGNSNNPNIEIEGYIIESHSLVVVTGDYSNSILNTIISLSGIRKDGYGVLLNFKKTVSNAEIDSLKLKLQKLDINAIHSFQISQTDSLPNHISIAAKNSKFIWILGKKDENKTFTDLIQNEINLLPDTLKPLIILNK